MYRLCKALFGQILACLFCLSAFSLEANYVSINDEFRMHYQQSGNGAQTIIFIPGWAMSSDIFKHQLAYFSDPDRYRSIAIDPRGQGASSKPETGYTYQQRGRDLAAFINALKLANVVLVGWSFGTLSMVSYV